MTGCINKPGRLGDALCVLLGAGLLADRAWRGAQVGRFFRRRVPPQRREVRLVSILQPILSGDLTMPACLERNLSMRTRFPLEYIWLVDTDDLEAQRTCIALANRHPDRSVQMRILPPGSAGSNPKTLKLIEGLRMAQGDVICVLDDDTMLPDGGLEKCLPYLDEPGVGLAFGLPYYANFSNIWSALVSAFVDSRSLLTYVPYTALTDPFTINGMFYCIRREVLEQVGGFDGLQDELADDFAVARRFREAGLRLAQTPMLHAISTQVAGPAHYLSLIQRWFIFPRESLMRYLSAREKAVLYAVGLVPEVCPLLLLWLAAKRPSAPRLTALLSTFAAGFAQFLRLNSRYLRGAVPPGRVWLVPLLQVLFPLQLLVALLSPRRIVWRGHVMRVEKGGTFRIVRRRQTASNRRPGKGQ